MCYDFARSEIVSLENPMQNENPRFILGLKLKKLRHERGSTLKNLSDQAGISVSYLSEIEKGKKYPKPERLLALAEALDVPFDELVSLKVTEELGPLKAALASPFMREFPFELFGLDPEDLFSLVNNDPARAGALFQTFLEVGRTYDVEVEHFLLAALRSYQQLHANYFDDLEVAAAKFRIERGWPAGRPVLPEELETILREEFTYEIDYEELGADPDLAGFRSVYRAARAGAKPRLYLNKRLMPNQRAFVLGREIGYRILDLRVRALSSSWLKVESFEQVLNNFKASYFSGAILLDRVGVEADLKGLFGRSEWDGQALIDCMSRYDATPETFSTRLTQLVPKSFGLEEIFFLRFSHRVGSDSFRLTKWLNLSRVPVPYGIGLNEHYCRRWPAMKLLGGAASREASREAPVISAQRSHFLGEDAEFFVISMMRPLALTDATNSSVSLGFLVNREFKRKVRFWEDPAIPLVDVNLTCERCLLEPSECTDRVVEPELVQRDEHQSRQEKALARLIENGSA